MVAAFVTIAIVEYLGSLIFPQPAPLDWTEQVSVDDWVASIPLAARLVVVAGWLLGALAGSAVAGRIARRPAIGWVPATLGVLAGIANITMIPHPLWMSMSAIVAPLVGGWIGTRMARTPPTPSCQRRLASMSLSSIDAACRTSDGPQPSLG